MISERDSILSEISLLKEIIRDCNPKNVIELASFRHRLEKIEAIAQSLPQTLQSPQEGEDDKALEELKASRLREYENLGAIHWEEVERANDRLYGGFCKLVSESLGFNEIYSSQEFFAYASDMCPRIRGSARYAFNLSYGWVDSSALLEEGADPVCMTVTELLPGGGWGDQIDVTGLGFLTITGIIS